jgi:putative transposase of IS4/5 family DUF4096
MRSNLFWLSDEQWKRIEPHLPTDVRGVERADDRRVISGIVHVLKSVRIPVIASTGSDAWRPPVPIDRDQCDSAVRCIF